MSRIRPAIKQMACRNWSLYNTAQQREKFIVMKLISDAVDFMEIPYCYHGNGRPHLDNADMLKICCYKTFSGISSRRFRGELLIPKALGFIEKIPHFNMINKYLNMESMSLHFERLYRVLAMPLAEVEQNFVADSTGFSTFGKKRWLDARLDFKERRDYVKLHIMSGVFTKIITSTKVTKGTANDAPFFEQLIRETAEQFRLREIAADAGYLSKRNCAIAAEVGAEPYIMPKINIRKFRIPAERTNQAWRNMIRLFVNNKPFFLEKYHKRSNVESVFSMIKRKFSPNIKSKNFVAQQNELLCLVACHNASVLCNTIFTANLDIKFE